MAAPLRTIALAGNPNCGKTTVFNALTGLRQKVANYPGITIERKSGRMRLPDGSEAEVIDLPGTYSLVPQSPDERVACEVLRGLRPDTRRPDVVVAVVDASNLPRTLFLVTQLRELGLPLVVALNMSDVAERRGQRVDAAALAAGLGVPVVPMVGHRGDGVEALRAALASAPIPAASPITALAVRGEVSGLEALGLPADRALRLLVGDTLPDLDADRAAHGAAIAAAIARLDASGTDPVQADVESRYRWIDALVATCVPPPRPGPTLTERVDAVLVHPLAGLAIFAVIMAALFTSIFWLADPLMGYVGAAVEAVGAWIGGLLEPGLLRSLIEQGLVMGVGTVLKFAPQIALLFLFLALLEDSGYLARAAFLMDRVLGRVGLHGRSFVPLLSSFACAIPGILATRTIADPRERLATILVAPFMSCSARLPVYGLLVGTFFAGSGALVQGLVVLACYALGILAAAATSLLLRGLRGSGGRSAFILELPTYKLPQLREVARQVWRGAADFITRAGTIIVAISIVLWALMTFPRLPEDRAEAVRSAAQVRLGALPAEAGADLREGRERQIAQAVQAAALEHSAAGRIGHAIEPAIAPLGYDWKIGVGVVAAFAAREVFVSTLGIVYSVGGVDDDTAPLEEAMLADRRSDGAPVWSIPVAASLLVWFVLAMQCMSTVAVVRRETGGWTWPLAQLVWMNAVAWIGAWITYRIALAVVGGP